MSEEKKIHQVYIIGAGPAGMTAAIYLKRANIEFKIVDKYAPGGKMNITAIVDNYPGYFDIPGPDLAFKMYEQLKGMGIDIGYADVKNITKVDEEFVIESDEGKEYAKAVIIATGTKERKLKIPGEGKYTNKGVSYCAVCDAALYKGQEIAIIGGGNSALEEAAFTAGIVDKIYLIHRRQEFRAEDLIVEEVKETKNIELVLDTIPLEILGDGNFVTGVKVKNIKTGEEKIIPVKAVFPFVGLDAVSDFLTELNVRDDKGYVLVDSEMMTSIPGLFSIGDVNQKTLRQIVTATSDGAIAALAANRYVKKKK
ncbi:MAG TPA: thioredoxin-disulfide reductase [Bacilli bacterium]|nr:thioredoxin-disulfide reductase [Bacilli bacterium]